MPLTTEQREKSLDNPAVCELLPVRDYLDGVAVRTNGAFVAGYGLRGAMSYFASDEERNHIKSMLEALLRAIPEQSMRIQIRYEVLEDVGDLLDRYLALRRTEDEAAIALDVSRVEAWHQKNLEGRYRRAALRLYLIWNPRIHHEVMGKHDRKKLRLTLTPQAAIERTQKEHLELLSEFESLLMGIEGTLGAAGLGARRMSDEEMFVEVKRALDPLNVDTRPLRRNEDALEFRSAREQATAVSIVDETENYINIDGLLYSFVSLKDLPDATFPGVLRELISLDFPVVINAQAEVPDQAKVLKGYKSRLRKMQAAQRDAHGGFRMNAEAQVAESQLSKVQQEIIASSVKTVKLSVLIGTRTSVPAITLADLEESERLLSSRRQQLLAAVTRMNGAKAVVETLAKRRLFFNSLPAMADSDKREHDMLSTNAADLLPVEMPWEGTPRSPLFLFQTPYSQLIPFSPFDPGLSDANGLVWAKTGGGKTLMMQMLLSMSARTRPVVSILEHGDSYEPLVTLMGGRMVTMSLDSNETINPWDLQPGELGPSKDQVSFLKNLTRHLLGEGHVDDSDLLDNLITEAILRVYKRAAIRQSNPIPTFGDLRDELAQWRDEEKNQRVMDQAHLASIKLRMWTGEKGVYSKLFDRPTTAALDNPWLFFNLEQLADDAKLQSAMSMVVARTMARRTSGLSSSIRLLILDELWAWLDSPVLAPEIEQEYRTARKRGVGIWGISHSPENIMGTKDKPRPNGAGILKNANTKIIGQQPGDTTPLREHLHLNATAINTIKHFSDPKKGKSGDALIVIGEKAETTHTIRLVPTPLEYWVMTTFPRERLYRRWWLERHRESDEPLIEAYKQLAEKFPRGLAELNPLPEETSGEVAEVKK